MELQVCHNLFHQGIHNLFSLLDMGLFSCKVLLAFCSHIQARLFYTLYKFVVVLVPQDMQDLLLPVMVLRKVREFPTTRELPTLRR